MIGSINNNTKLANESNKNPHFSYPSNFTSIINIH